MPRCLFINTFYDGFLRQEYGRHPELSTAPYDTQLQHLNDQLFGDSDFYSSGLIMPASMRVISSSTAPSYRGNMQKNKA